MDLIYEQILRVVACALVGAGIGFEREIRNKPAGFFTFTLVSIGSCLIAILQQNLANDTIALVQNDPSLIGVISVDQGRIIAQVVSGIGFLGAGTIIHNRASVKGITTAAMLWMVAGLGLLIGTGGLFNYIIAGVTTLIILPLAFFSRKLTDRISRTKKVQRIRIVFDENAEKQLFENLASQGVIVRKSYLMNKTIVDGRQLKESIIYFSLPKTRKFEDVMNQISMFEFVVEIEEA
jgi:putative Mg2+ transporter-C (MgtC) family protein